MKNRDFILSVIGVCSNRSEFGRTSLQKTCYLAAEHLEVDLGHRAHFFGPFSEDVERLTGALVLSGLVEERVKTLGFVNEAGYEGKRYEYCVTESGEDRLTNIRRLHEVEFRNIQEFIDSLVKVLGSLEQRILSLAGKVYYIATQEKRWLEYDEISRVAKTLGWDLGVGRVKSVAKGLKDLGLMRIRGFPS